MTDPPLNAVSLSVGKFVMYSGCGARVVMIYEQRLEDYD